MILEIQGQKLKEFIKAITSRKPPLAQIHELQVQDIPSRFSNRFEILASENGPSKETLISPDMAICNHCRREFSEPRNRRFQYPFINCTDCGPSLLLRDKKGQEVTSAIELACEKLKNGQVAAVKGLGGYHLACLANSDSAVLRLRKLKRRESKTSLGLERILMPPAGKLVPRIC